MKKKTSLSGIFAVAVLLVFSLFMIWFIPSFSTVRVQLEQAKQDLETSRGRERKQQEEYNNALEELPLVEQELEIKNPLADEAEQKLAVLKARRKELRAEKKSLESPVNSEDTKEGSFDGR